MPYLYRAERLEALNGAHRSLLARSEGTVFWLFDDCEFHCLQAMLYDPNKLHKLDDELDEIAQGLLKKIESTSLRTPYLKGALRAQVTGSVFSPFWKAAQDFLIQTYSVRNASLRTQKQSVLELLAILPLLNDIYQVNSGGRRPQLKQNIFSNLILTLLNPIKMLHSLLTFVERAAYRILEVGLTPPIQTFLKGVVGVAATIIRVPLTILQPFSDILPVVVNNLVIQPVKYVKNRVFLPTRHEVDLDDATTLDEHLGHSPRSTSNHKAALHKNSPVNDSSRNQFKRQGFFEHSTDDDNPQENPFDNKKGSGPSNWRV